MPHEHKDFIPQVAKELPKWGTFFVVLWGAFNIHRDVSDLKRDRYSAPMAAEDALREAIANPGHRVPDPRNPGQYITVQLATTSRDSEYTTVNP